MRNITQLSLSARRSDRPDRL